MKINLEYLIAFIAFIFAVIFFFITVAYWSNKHKEFEKAKKIAEEKEEPCRIECPDWTAPFKVASIAGFMVYVFLWLFCKTFNWF